MAATVPVESTSDAPTDVNDASGDKPISAFTGDAPDDNEGPPAIVIDNGSESIKAGFAGDDDPKAVFPNIAGRPKVQVTTTAIKSCMGSKFGKIRPGSAESAALERLKKFAQTNNGRNIVSTLVPSFLNRSSSFLQAGKVGMDLKDCYVGEEAQTYRGMLNIKYPIEYGIVTNWDDMESVWYHTFHNELKVSPEGSHIFLTETCHNPHENSEKTIEIMFEKFKASGAHLAYQAPLAMFGAGRTDGVVLDCGHGITQAMPISDGKIILDSAMLCNLAGGYINSYLAHLLSLDGHSVTTAADKEDIIKIKHDLCYVAEDYKSESEKASSSKTLEKDFKPPSGAAITIGSELFKSTECLFQPSLLGIDGVLTSVHETLFYSIMKCPRDKHAMLFKNIVLSGGTTLLKGFKERIQKEVRALAPPGTAVKVVAAPDRNLLVWIGGAIMASLSTFDAYWIKKSDYDEYGPAIVHDFRYQ